jgi:hypothetical protein
MTNRDKICRQLNNYNSRIFQLNERFYELNASPQLNMSELRKVEKSKSKLIKARERLLKKLEGVQDEGNIYDEEWQDDSRI